MLSSLGFGVCPLAPSPADCENDKSKNNNQYLLETEVSKVFIGLIGFKDVKLCAIPVIKSAPVSNGN